MKEQISKNEYQKRLFDLVKDYAPKNQVLVDVVSDLLGISTDAAYRRMRCEKNLDFQEALELCQHFNISIDELVNISKQDSVRCHYTPIDLNDNITYPKYLQSLLNHITEITNKPDSEVLFTLTDIPIYNYFDYKELTTFKLYTWNSSACGFKAGYDTFAKQWNYDEISHYYKEIVKNYQLTPSTEIWTSQTIDQTLRFINYHYEMGHFEDPNIPIVLCEQLLDMINTIHNWTVKGCKGKYETPFKFYVSETDLINNFVLFKSNEYTSCSIRLFTINHFNLLDRTFCKEAENWINTAIQRSTLISGSAEKQRYKFFNEQREKINRIMEKLVKIV